jgi:hypothetical protein
LDLKSIFTPIVAWTRGGGVHETAVKKVEKLSYRWENNIAFEKPPRMPELLVFFFSHLTQILFIFIFSPLNTHARTHALMYSLRRLPHACFGMSQARF